MLFLKNFIDENVNLLQSWVRADPLPPQAVNSQSDGEAGEHCGCGVKDKTQGVAECHHQYAPSN